jgi:transcription initiation factor TFIIIB Brf1 subunit/transcription initiation factor TFIIB
MQVSDKWFDIYNKLQECEKVDIKTDCSHAETLAEQGAITCTLCGMEVTQQLTYDKEWKYYGMQDSKHTSDPSRCYIRKVKDKTIYSDVQHLSISTHILDIANNIYIQSCKEAVHRGTFRKGIIFASIFHAYKLDNNPQSCESLIKIFKIKRKDALKGLKFVNENAPRDSPIRTTYITPEHIIHEFLHHFDVSIAKRGEIIELYHSVKDKSSILNRSRPQSVGAGVLWYWISKNNIQITIKNFIQKIGLSELTVTKISKEIDRMLN